MQYRKKEFGSFTRTYVLRCGKRNVSWGKKGQVMKKAFREMRKRGKK